MATPAVRPPVHLASLYKAGIVVVALLVGSVGLTSCSAIDRVKSTVDDIRGNQATIDAFSSKLQSGAAAPFEATYVTTGSAPATIVYAVRPPTGVAFSETPSEGSGTTPVHLVVDSSGEFACTQPSSPGSPWTCQKLGNASAATENKLFDLYTPSHWVSFLKGVSLVAGLAGDKVTSSSMTVNGFSMNCVDLPGLRRTRDEHDLHHLPGHPRLREGGFRRDELRNPELFLVPCGLAVRAATGRHGHQRHLRNLIGRPISPPCVGWDRAAILRT